MASTEDFQAAVDRVNNLARTPNQDEMLNLYGLYKQATSGDVSGKRPGMLDVKGRAKFDAWTKCKGLSADDARQKYVSFVESLEKKYN